MSKTIKQTLIDEVHYPISEGFIENALWKRGLNPQTVVGQNDNGANITALLTSSPFRGAVADCLYSLIEAPNVSESDKSFSLGDKELILRKVNSIYKSIGEEPVALGETPKVYIL